MSVFSAWLDVGGTFTDCVLMTANGQKRTGKFLSTGITKGSIEAGSNSQIILAAVLREDVAGFWVGFRMRLLDERGQSLATGVVVQHDPSLGQMILAEPMPVSVQQDQIFELQSDLEAPALAVRRMLGLPLAAQIPALDLRMGTTRGTNALLTRRGAATGLVTTKGFGDCLAIGDQDRPELFALTVKKRPPLAQVTVEVEGRLAADGSELAPIDREQVRAALRSLHEQNCRSLAVCLLHAWRNPAHEKLVEQIAREEGFADISLSSVVAPLIRLIPRAETTVLDAYLNPILGAYVARVWEQLGGPQNCSFRLMTSAGVLVGAESMRGKDSVLSGPAGGTVALAAVARSHGFKEAIGLDMGGTSTDVSRIDGEPIRHFEAIKAGIRILTPSMAIQTVAAGGGSICGFDGQRLFVGPDSAGADPGPACYGRGGPLAVTDLNLVLGRVSADGFPFLLHREASVQRLGKLQNQIASSSSFARGNQTEDLSQLRNDTPENLAEGYWRIANHAMAEAVRSISIAEGVDPRPVVLVGFGGAAGQHLCAIADILGMQQALDHVDAGVLSALGMGLAEIGRTAVRGIYQPLTSWPAESIQTAIDALCEQNIQSLAAEGLARFSPTHKPTLELRYQGTDSTLEIPATEHDYHSLATTFGDEFRRRFGYDRERAPIELVCIRVTSTAQSATALKPVETLASSEPSAFARRPLWWNGAWIEANVYQRPALGAGDSLHGPALVIGSQSTLVVDPHWRAVVAADRSILLSRMAANEPAQTKLPAQVTVPQEAACATTDPILVEILSRRFQAIADQMGLTLQRTAVSVNIKERRDFSCAVFRCDGSLVANAPHVPVHLGAMGHTVRHVLQRFPDLAPDDCVITNDPYAGGSHLPDITVISGVFTDDSGRPKFVVANRAHHAEIGGLTPASMPPQATCLLEEGVVIRDFLLVDRGQSRHQELMQLLRTARYPSRRPDENVADLIAQQAANRQGVLDLQRLCSLYGTSIVDQCMQRLQDQTAEAMAIRLAKLPGLPLQFVDFLDDGVPIAVRVTRQQDRICIDFNGTGKVHPRNFNATRGIVTAAVMYVLRVLIEQPLPLNEGVLRKVELVIPPGLLDPPPHDDPGLAPAVVAGNVETSQRIVDVLFGAFGVCAASQGTMNNFLLGDASFGYYETICGGSGATKDGQGADAVHTHMTNTRITNPEILETRLPVRLIRFAIRRKSGGRGQHRGGDGVIRELEFLHPLNVSLVTSRRGPYPPYGTNGGLPGKFGDNIRIHLDGREERLPNCVYYHASVGERIRIETPGGGGWGLPSIESS